FAGAHYEVVGALLMRHRRFHPAIGLWLSRDKLALKSRTLIFASDRSIYGFNNNNPINYIDPSGEVPVRATNAKRREGGCKSVCCKWGMRYEYAAIGGVGASRGITTTGT